MTLVTKYYKSVLEAEHAAGPWGTMSLLLAPQVVKLAQRYKCKTILDYGAGAGNLAIALSEIDPELTVIPYEPGRPEWSSPPKPAKCVACIDVLEHVEPECVEAVLDDLKRVTLGVALFNISLRPAKRVLNNGWNAHISLLSAADWMHKIESRFIVLDLQHNLDPEEITVIVKKTN